MQDNDIVFSILKTIFVCTSPITFIVGLFLLFDVETYMKLEKALSKSYFTPKKTFIHHLEKNRESLQMFLLKKRRLIGVVCVINAIISVYVVMRLLK